MRREVHCKRVNTCNRLTDLAGLARPENELAQARYQFNLVRIDLAAATGTIQEAVRTLGEQKQ